MRLLLLALLLASCTTAPTPKEEPPVVVEKPQPPVVGSPQQLKADWDGVKGAENFTALTLKALEDHGHGLLSAPIEGVCGNRPEFFLMFFSALARFESAFKPEARYMENFKDAKGNYVNSRGLFQMSIESSNGNYACGFKNEQEIHKPELAIPCMVKAMNKLITRDGKLFSTSAPWKGAAAYWSPLRDTAKRNAIMAKARGTCK